MRKLLDDRRLAAGVLAIAVLIFTPLGAKLSLRRAVNRVEAGLGIDGYLTDSENAARNLITLGSALGLEEQTDVLRQRLKAMEELQSGDSVSAKAQANRELADAFEQLRSAIAGLELAERDAESLEIYTSAFTGPQSAISRSGYNEDVAGFMDGTYNKFPTKLLARLLGVDPPEYFM